MEGHFGRYEWGENGSKPYEDSASDGKFRSALDSTKQVNGNLSLLGGLFLA